MPDGILVCTLWHSLMHSFGENDKDVRAQCLRCRSHDWSLCIAARSCRKIGVRLKVNAVRGRKVGACLLGASDFLSSTRVTGWQACSDCIGLEYYNPIRRAPVSRSAPDTTSA